MVQTLRSRWFAGCVHGALWLLLYLGATHLGGKAPVFHDAEAFSPPPESPAPVGKLDALFSPNIWPQLVSVTNPVSNPFVTRYFVPKAAAPVPPPTTRKIDLTYLGSFETAGHARHAYVKLFETVTVKPLGGCLASNLYVAQITMQTLTLTNPAAQTNMLPLNKKQEIEVPLK